MPNAPPPRKAAAVRDAAPVEAMAIAGRARVDARTKELVKRLRRGEIAVIDHEDLDATAAQALADCKPAAVVNRSASITGRYPNGGPGVLLSEGIPLFDAVEGDALTAKLVKTAPLLESLDLGGRTAVILSPYDISCALEKGASLECKGYIPQDAARIGANVVLYGLQQ